MNKPVEWVYPVVIYDESGIPVAATNRSFGDRQSAVMSAIRELALDYDSARELVVALPK